MFNYKTKKMRKILKNKSPLEVSVPNKVSIKRVFTDMN